MTYSKCFLGCLQIRLIRVNNVKSVFSNNASAKNIKNISFNGVFVISAIVWNKYVDAWLFAKN